MEDRELILMGRRCHAVIILWFLLAISSQCFAIQNEGSYDARLLPFLTSTFHAPFNGIVRKAPSEEEIFYPIISDGLIYPPMLEYSSDDYERRAKHLAGELFKGNSALTAFGFRIIPFIYPQAFEIYGKVPEYATMERSPRSQLKYTMAREALQYVYSKHIDSAISEKPPVEQLRILGEVQAQLVNPSTSVAQQIMSDFKERLEILDTVLTDKEILDRISGRVLMERRKIYGVLPDPQIDGFPPYNDERLLTVPITIAPLTPDKQDDTFRHIRNYCSGMSRYWSTVLDKGLETRKDQKFLAIRNQSLATELLRPKDIEIRTVVAKVCKDLDGEISRYIQLTQWLYQGVETLFNWLNEGIWPYLPSNTGDDTDPYKKGKQPEYDKRPNIEAWIANGRLANRIFPDASVSQADKQTVVSLARTYWYRAMEVLDPNFRFQTPIRWVCTREGKSQGQFPDCWDIGNGWFDPRIEWNEFKKIVTIQTHISWRFKFEYLSNILSIVEEPTISSGQFDLTEFSLHGLQLSNLNRENNEYKKLFLENRVQAKRQFVWSRLGISPQDTVGLVARKRLMEADISLMDVRMADQIKQKLRDTKQILDTEIERFNGGKVWADRPVRVVQVHKKYGEQFKQGDVLVTTTPIFQRSMAIELSMQKVEEMQLAVGKMLGIWFEKEAKLPIAANISRNGGGKEESLLALLSRKVYADSPIPAVISAIRESEPLQMEIVLNLHPTEKHRQVNIADAELKGIDGHGARRLLQKWGFAVTQVNGTLLVRPLKGIVPKGVVHRVRFANKPDE